jgi:hypothetical protein
MKIALAAFPFLAVQYCFAFVLPEGHPPTQSVFNIEELLHKWQAPGSTDKRSPCPALNALANHGYLNRNGKQLTAKAMQNAMSLVYNLSPAFGDALATAAVKGLSPNGTSIDLDQLQLHGFIEHDASLVHKDSALGPNWIVDKELLDQFISMAYVQLFINNNFCL